MTTAIRLGLRANAVQFTLLVIVNAFVGAMIGMERSILPAIGEQEFDLSGNSAITSFIVVFGLSKALANYVAGNLSDRFGRRKVLLLGWYFAIPVPFLLIWAPSWNWILLTNLLLGISQGLCWSTTVVMKIDLAGPRNRGLAMGLNEFAGYVAVAASAWATGWLAVRYGLRPEPFYLGFAFVALGAGLSFFAVRETKVFAELEASQAAPQSGPPHMTQRDIFWRTSLSDRNLSSACQAGLVNNLNDGMAWGIFPLFFAQAGLSLANIGLLAAIYPATWGICQLFTGALSDRIGRKWLIVSGMTVQAFGIIVVIQSAVMPGFATGSMLLGLGTAMVYPTLLAAIGDVAQPGWRASAVGIYRLWRDLGYAVGALIAGLSADAFGLAGAMWVVALLTFASAVLVTFRMDGSLGRQLLVDGQT